MPLGLWGCPWGKGVAPGEEGSPKGKGSPPKNWGPTPKMVWGHNLQRMAPFGALTSGFCMVFQYATLIFLIPGPIFGAPGQGLGPQRPGGPFWAQNGGPENITLWRDRPPQGFAGFFARGKVCMVPRNLLGVPISPQTLPGKGFTSISPKPENPRGGPAGPLGGFPIRPLWARGPLQGSAAWPQALCICSVECCLRSCDTCVPCNSSRLLSLLFLASLAPT